VYREEATVTFQEWPDRLKEFFKWIDEEHSAEEVLQRIQDHLAEVHREIEGLQAEARTVESLLGFLGEHHLSNHAGEPVRAKHFFVLEKEERSERILDIAQEIVDEGHLVVTPRDVLKKLIEHHWDLDVKYPTTVIGNVLARSPNFKRLGRNRFEYVGARTKRRPRPTGSQTPVVEEV
jgi:hypothetical protein